MSRVRRCRTAFAAAALLVATVLPALAGQVVPSIQRNAPVIPGAA